MVHPLNLTDLAPTGGAAPGAPLLFGHGYGCDQSMWEPVAERLPHLRRLLFDWPGAGPADLRAYDPARHEDLEGYADDLLALMATQDLRDTVFVGHSVGASIGLIAAARDPSRFGLLVLVAPSPCFADHPPDYHGGFQASQLADLVAQMAVGLDAWSGPVATMVAGPEAGAPVSDRLVRAFCAMDPTIAIRWARATFLADIRDRIPHVQVPTAVLQARDDLLAPPVVGDWMVRTLPRGRLIRLQAPGHCPHLSAPSEVASVIDGLRTWRG